MHKDPVHKKIMSTKQKLQEDDDYEAQEAIKYAVKKTVILMWNRTQASHQNFRVWYKTWGSLLFRSIKHV